MLIDFSPTDGCSDPAALKDLMAGAAAALLQRRCAAGRRVRLVAFGRRRHECAAASRREFERLERELVRVEFGREAEFSAAFALESSAPGELAVVTGEPSEELRAQVLAAAEQGRRISAVICVEAGEYPQSLMRALGDFRMAGVSAALLVPGDDLGAGLRGC